MHIDMTGGKPIRCSKCGSTNAIKPVNNRDIVLRCADCGHTKLTREAEEREYGYPRTTFWNAEDRKDADPTF